MLTSSDIKNYASQYGQPWDLLDLHGRAQVVANLAKELRTEFADASMCVKKEAVSQFIQAANEALGV